MSSLRERVRIFVSSTLDAELTPHREALFRHMRQADWIEPVYRDGTTGARSAAPETVSLDALEGCSAFVMVIGARVGPISRAEFEKATGRMRRLIYVSEPIDGAVISEDRSERDEFVQGVQGSDVTTATFADAGRLAAQVLADLSREFSGRNRFGPASVDDRELPDQPYPLLEPYSGRFKALYQGRQAEYGQLVSAVHDGTRRVVLFYAPSGQGKSSLLRARVVPRLKELGWTVDYRDRLGSLDMLRGLFAPSEGDGRRLVVLDQAEEIFTTLGAERGVDDASALLRSFADRIDADARRSTVLLLAFRDEFLARFRRVLDVERLRPVEVDLGPMSHDDLVEAMLAPSRRPKYGFEFVESAANALATEIRKGTDVAGPVLQVVCARLFENAKSGNGVIDDDLVRSAGSVGEALRDFVRREVDRFGKRRVRALQALSLLFESRGDGRYAVPQPRDELERRLPHDILDKLIEAKVVSSSEGHVRLMHESLVGPIQELLDEADAARARATQQIVDRYFTAWTERFTPTGTSPEDAREATPDGDREVTSLDPDAQGLLLPGRLLKEVEPVRSGLLLSPEQEHYLALSQDLVTMKSRQAARRRIALTSLILALLSASGFLLYFWRESRKARTTLASELVDARFRAGQMAAATDGHTLRLAHYTAQAAAAAVDPARQTDMRIACWSALRSLPTLLGICEHDESVGGAVFSKDDERVLTWSYDGSARIWSAKDGSAFAIPMKHDQPVRGAVFSTNQDCVLTWSDDGSARIWSAKDGAAVTAPMKHDQGVLGAVFSKDEERVLTWSADGSARIWSARDGSALTAPMKHEHSVSGAVLSNDEDRVLTWSLDGSARIWSAGDGSALTAPMKHDHSVSGAVLSKDDDRVLTWSLDRSARIWSAKDGSALTAPMKHDRWIKGAVFSKDDERVLTWSEDGSARIWSAKDGSALTVPMKHDQEVWGAVFSKDDERVLTWSRDRSARIWSAKDGSALTVPIKHDQEVWGAVFSRDDERVLTWCGDGSARIWSAKDGSAVTAPMKHDQDLLGAIFSKDEERVLTWSGDGSARIWSAKDGSALTAPMKHDQSVLGAVFSKDAERVLTWSHDGSARIWSPKDGSALTPPMKHDQSVWERVGAVFSKDEECVLTWSSDRSARIWSAKDGSALTAPMKHDQSVLGAVFSKNNERVLTWSSDGSARIWNAEDGSALTVPMKHDQSVLGAVFSKNNERVLTWSEDASARIWSAKDGSALTAPMKHDKSIGVGVGAVFNKNEERVLTWSGDGSARIWSAKDGSALTAPMKHDQSVLGAVFSKDDERVLTWSGDGSARIWSAKDGSALTAPMKHDKSDLGAVFSKDEERVLTWSENGSARIWSAKDGSAVTAPMKHDYSVLGGVRAVFSKDEERVLTWGGDGASRIWRAKDGSAMTTPMKHDWSVLGAVFSKDEERVLTWSGDGSARIWSAKNGSAVTPPMKHDKSVFGRMGAVFSKDEERVLTWSGDDSARIWSTKDGSALTAPMKHKKSVLGGVGAVFSKDERLVLTWGSEARLWNIDGLCGAPPAALPALVEALTGTRLDPSGAALVLNLDQWRQRKTECADVLQQLGK